jgi:hypothetical protein
MAKKSKQRIKFTPEDTYRKMIDETGKEVTLYPVLIISQHPKTGRTRKLLGAKIGSKNGKTLINDKGEYVPYKMCGYVDKTSLHLKMLYG